MDGVPTDNTTNNAYPLRVLYTVGLQDGVLRADGTLNTDPAQGGVSAEYLAAHTENGQVYFYSNLYEDDREGTVTVGSSNAAFTSADTNPFYFLQQDLPVYLDRACTRRADAAVFDPGRSYYIQQSYYAGAGSAVTARTYVYERSGESMAPYVTRTAEGWSIRRGAPRLGNLSDLIRLKTADPTGTAAAAFYPTFQGQDVYDGRFVSYLGNNGRLALRAPAALTIAKQVEAAPGLTAPQQAEFAFTLSIPARPGRPSPAQRPRGGRRHGGGKPDLFACGRSGLHAARGRSADRARRAGARLQRDRTRRRASARLCADRGPPPNRRAARSRRGRALFGRNGLRSRHRHLHKHLYGRFDPAGARIELPVAKELTGDRTAGRKGRAIPSASPRPPVQTPTLPGCRCRTR